jgi:hypothetical protein
MLRRVALVRTDVSEELGASFIMVTRFGELGTMLVRASVVPSSPILVTLMKEALISSKTSVLTEPHGVISQKTPFFTSSVSFLIYLPLKRKQNFPLLPQWRTRLHGVTSDDARWEDIQSHTA